MMSTSVSVSSPVQLSMHHVMFAVYRWDAIPYVKPHKKDLSNFSQILRTHYFRYASI